MVVFKNVKKEKLKFLEKEGFVKEEIKTIHEEIRLKKNGLVLILYNSGKLLLQGKKDVVKNFAETLAKKNIGKEVKAEIFRREVGVMTGSDESLKGDTFGGIVVAAVKADKKIREELVKLGVADSKKLSDKEILNMAEKIKNVAACSIRSLLPEDYNKFSGNVTKLLNKLHKAVADDLQTAKHVVDLYPGCDVGDIREVRAESKYVEVAAASILARSAAVRQLNSLSVMAGFDLPKGSTHVQKALAELKDKRLDFKRFVKTNFKNVEEFL